MTTTIAIPEPCGYCRRCAVHDDPGGCLEVERWEREHPEEAIAAIEASEWMAPEAKAYRIEELRVYVDGFRRGQAARERFDQDMIDRLTRTVDPFARAHAEADVYDQDFAGAFDGHTVTSDADPGL